LPNNNMLTTRQRGVALGGLHVFVPTTAILAVCLASAVSAAAAGAGGWSAPTLPAIAGSLFYTATGAWNLRLLLHDEALHAPMAYTNSIMSWSAFFFGVQQIAFDAAPGSFSTGSSVFHFGEWAVLPNFAWGLEWALQLFSVRVGSGWRALLIMGASIASYGLKFAFSASGTNGFRVALVPQPE
jgi:hypothetical protein